MVPEEEAVITFRIPSGVDGGAAVFNCYFNGKIIGTESVDNVAYASTVSVTVKGSGRQTVILEAINKDKNESVTVGEYDIDFDEHTVSEKSFEKALLRELFSDEFTVPEPDITQDGGGETTAEDDYIDLNDDEFWESLLNGY